MTRTLHDREPTTQTHTLLLHRWVQTGSAGARPDFYVVRPFSIGFTGDPDSLVHVGLLENTQTADDRSHPMLNGFGFGPLRGFVDREKMLSIILQLNVLVPLVV